MERSTLGLVAGLIIVASVVVHLTLGVPGSSTDNNSPPSSPPEQPPGGTLEDNLKTALAENQEVSAGEISIQFYAPTETQGVIAVGAVIDNRASNLFFYDLNSREITEMVVDEEAENDEIAAVWAMCSQKTSEGTMKKLVPWGFSKIENQNIYLFTYADDYISEWAKWSMGIASINMDNEEIVWMASF